MNDMAKADLHLNLLLGWLIKHRICNLCFQPVFAVVTTATAYWRGCRHLAGATSMHPRELSTQYVPTPTKTHNTKNKETRVAVVVVITVVGESCCPLESGTSLWWCMILMLSSLSKHS
jgi:hypothetical protein